MSSYSNSRSNKPSRVPVRMWLWHRSALDYTKRQVFYLFAVAERHKLHLLTLGIANIKTFHSVLLLTTFANNYVSKARDIRESCDMCVWRGGYGSIGQVALNGKNRCTENFGSKTWREEKEETIWKTQSEMDNNLKLDVSWTLVAQGRVQ